MGIETELPTRDALVCETLSDPSLVVGVTNPKETHESLAKQKGSKCHELLITAKWIPRRNILWTFIGMQPIEALGHNVVEGHIHI